MLEQETGAGSLIKDFFRTKTSSNAIKNHFLGGYIPLNATILDDIFQEYMKPNIPNLDTVKGIKITNFGLDWDNIFTTMWDIQHIWGRSTREFNCGWMLGLMSSTLNLNIQYKVIR